MMAGGSSGARFGALALCALLAGCGTPRLAGMPTRPVELGGHWVLDAAASDDAAKLVSGALPKPVERRPPVADDGTGWGGGMGGGRRGGGDSGDGRRGGGRRGGSESDSEGYATLGRERDPVWGRMRPWDYVSAFALPPKRLDISQSPGRVNVGSGDRVRAYVPADEEPVAITDRYGSRNVRAGWQDDAFVVSSVDGNRLTMLETLRHTREDRLERTVDLRISGVKSLKLRAVYRRATASELDTSTLEGPPAPTTR